MSDAFIFPNMPESRDRESEDRDLDLSELDDYEPERDSGFTKQDAVTSMLLELKERVKCYKKVLPNYIFWEHCTGQNLFEDVSSLERAYILFANRGK